MRVLGSLSAVCILAAGAGVCGPGSHCSIESDNSDVVQIKLGAELSRELAKEGREELDYWQALSTYRSIKDDGASDAQLDHFIQNTGDDIHEDHIGEDSTRARWSGQKASLSLYVKGLDYNGIRADVFLMTRIGQIIQSGIASVFDVPPANVLVTVSPGALEKRSNGPAIRGSFPQPGALGSPTWPSGPEKADENCCAIRAGVIVTLDSPVMRPLPQCMNTPMKNSFLDHSMENIFYRFTDGAPAARCTRSAIQVTAECGSASPSTFISIATTGLDYIFLITNPSLMAEVNRIYQDDIAQALMVKSKHVQVVLSPPALGGVSQVGMMIANVTIAPPVGTVQGRVPEALDRTIQTHLWNTQGIRRALTWDNIKVTLLDYHTAYPFEDRHYDDDVDEGDSGDGDGDRGAGAGAGADEGGGSDTSLLGTNGTEDSQKSTVPVVVEM